MVAKYHSGVRVRIKDVRRVRGPFSDVRQYQDQTGEIIESTALVAYLARPWADEASSPTQLLHVYKVRLDAGIEIDYVIEECLEASENS